MDKSLLDNPARRALVDYIEEHPGVHLGEVVRSTGLGWGNAHHHLDRLERAGIITREPEGNKVRLFVQGQVPREVRHTFALLQNDALRTVFDVVDERPGIMQRDIAEQLGVTATAVRKHLHRLEREGLVHAERRGRAVHYEVSPEIPPEALGPRTREPPPKEPHPDVTDSPPEMAEGETPADAKQAKNPERDDEHDAEPAPAEVSHQA